MQFSISFIVFFIACFASTTNAFQSHRFARTRALSLAALDPKALEKLETMKVTYDRLVNVVSPEAEAEAAQLKETVEKYDTYLSVKKMMQKLRIMYKDEASDQRKAKQLKNFLDLFKGKVELENLLLQKLGLPATQTTNPPELQQLMKLEEEVKALEGKLEKVKIQLPAGQSTIEARFGY